MAPETRLTQSSSEVIIAYLKSEEFKELIESAVESRTRRLHEEITTLREEVVILRESNIQLLHVISNPSYSKMVQKNNNDIKTSKIDKYSEPYSQVPAKNPINNGKKNNRSKTIEVENNSSKKVEVKSKKSTSNANNSSQIIGEIESENQQLKKDGEQGWTIQGRRQRNVKSMVYGKLTNGTLFKGVIKYIDYHIFNCDRDMKIEDLKNYLTEEIKIPDIICEAMESKHPEKYKSFKISVPVNYVEIFKNPDIWPEYICINRFNNRFLRKKAPETSEKKN